MGRRDYGDMIGGAALTGFGLFVALYAFRNYAIGSITEMGPGMVPAGLGMLLTALGAAIFVPALFRAGEMPQVAWRPFVFVLLALAAFALLVERVGLIPSIYALVFLALLGDDERRGLISLYLGTVLNAIVIVLFVYGLGMPFRLLAWDF